MSNIIKVKDNNGNWLGIPALRGEDGITPHIGENGNWFIGETDTGIKADLEIASADTLGGIKVGENLTITEDGTLNAVVPEIDVQSVITYINEPIDFVDGTKPNYTNGWYVFTKGVTFNGVDGSSANGGWIDNNTIIYIRNYTSGIYFNIVAPYRAQSSNNLAIYRYYNTTDNKWYPESATSAYNTTALTTSTGLSKTNTTAYTPTNDYHPATKRYVDSHVEPYIFNYNDTDANITTHLQSSIVINNSIMSIKRLPMVMYKGRILAFSGLDVTDSLYTYNFTGLYDEDFLTTESKPTVAEVYIQIDTTNNSFTKDAKVHPLGEVIAQDQEQKIPTLGESIQVHALEGDYTITTIREQVNASKIGKHVSGIYNYNQQIPSWYPGLIAVSGYVKYSTYLSNTSFNITINGVTKSITFGADEGKYSYSGGSEAITNAFQTKVDAAFGEGVIQVKVWYSSSSYDVHFYCSQLMTLTTGGDESQGLGDALSLLQIPSGTTNKVDWSQVICRIYGDAEGTEQQVSINGRTVTITDWQTKNMQQAFDDINNANIGINVVDCLDHFEIIATDPSITEITITNGYFLNDLLGIYNSSTAINKTNAIIELSSLDETIQMELQSDSLNTNNLNIFNGIQSQKIQNKISLMDDGLINIDGFFKNTLAILNLCF